MQQVAKSVVVFLVVQIVSAQVPGFDTDQFFSPNFFQMDQMDAPAVTGKVDRALNRCQSVPVGKNMDLTPIHIKSPASEQQYNEKLEAFGVLSSTKSTPVSINQYQVALHICFN